MVVEYICTIAQNRKCTSRRQQFNIEVCLLVAGPSQSLRQVIDDFDLPRSVDFLYGARIFALTKILNVCRTGNQS